MQTKPQINIMYVSQLLQADESLIPETELILSPISSVGNTCYITGSIDKKKYCAELFPGN